VHVSPSNEELYAKIQALSEKPRQIAEDPMKKVDVPSNSTDSLSMPIKVIVSPSKKSSLSNIQQTSKNPPQPFVSQQQHTQLVI